ncbi:MAG: DUF5060 domain-containing protein, partial [Chloroflexota bacterium]
MHSSKKILISVAFFIVATMIIVQLSMSSAPDATFAQTNPTRTPSAETNPTRTPIPTSTSTLPSTPTPTPPTNGFPTYLPIIRTEGSPSPSPSPTPLPSPTSAPSITINLVNGGDSANGLLFTPLDIRFDNPTWSDNPFDTIAIVTFVHQGSNTTRQTEMYYNGGNEWRARFTADQTGVWIYTT